MRWYEVDICTVLTAMCLQEGPGQLELVAVAPLARGTAVSLVQVAVLVHRQPERSVHRTPNIFGAVSRYFPHLW